MKFGNTRSYWIKYYQDRYNKDQNWQAEQLAIWYLILYEAFGNE